MIARAVFTKTEGFLMPSFHYESIIDLTHPINLAIPVWPGDPAVVLFPLNHLEKDGFNLGGFTMGEHTGTHIGVAAHFHDNETTLDKLLPSTLFRPCVVIDVAKECEANAEYEANAECEANVAHSRSGLERLELRKHNRHKIFITHSTNHLTITLVIVSPRAVTQGVFPT